jgi:mannose/cellobiose epimerase-like protein (N-acyl-D-glucosamine 2-epimerase family)
MNRRTFFEQGLAAGLGLVAVGSAPGLLLGQYPQPAGAGRRTGIKNLGEHAAELRKRLFDEYLPFWEEGGYDRERGGFMCYLYDDGSVQDGRKDIWYQGRGIWVYSFLYNHIDPNPKWLDMARKSRDFMVEYMHNGDGTWLDTVNRMGEPAEGIDYSRSGNIYGALFAAAGLIQLARATGSQEDLDLARMSIRKSVARYDDPAYPGIATPASERSGLRAQGHSFMFSWIVPQLLELDADPWFEDLANTHLELIAERFWNPEYGISNEILFHDHSRIPALADRMVPGHSIEAQWMCMDAASRLGQTDLVPMFRTRMRRLIEMTWDHVFGGIGDTDYRVFATDNHSQGPEFGIKSMWAQAEVLVGTLMAYADTEESWALEWYEREWGYVD